MHLLPREAHICAYTKQSRENEEAKDTIRLQKVRPPLRHYVMRGHYTTVNNRMLLFVYSLLAIAAKRCGAADLRERLITYASRLLLTKNKDIANVKGSGTTAT